MASLFAVPVVVVTGLVLTDAVWAKEVGVEGVIHKPVEPDHLLNLIHRRIRA